MKTPGEKWDFQSLTPNVLLFQNIPVSSGGRAYPRPKPVSQQFLHQADSVRPCPVENQNSFCLSYVPVNYSKLILTLACLQNYFVRSLFLVVKSESLKMKTLYST